MGRNILVLTGSPRKGGNSETLADAFIEGAASAGHNINKFQAAFKKIDGCRACEKCWTTGTACVFRDGFAELEPLLESADTLVFATPLYFFTYSAQIRAATDRFFAYISPLCLRPLKIKDTILLTCAEMEEDWIFDGLIASYKNSGRFMNWNDKGIIAVPEVSKKGDIAGSPYLDKARNLCKSLG